MGFSAGIYGGISGGYQCMSQMMREDDELFKNNICCDSSFIQHYPEKILYDFVKIDKNTKIVVGLYQHKYYLYLYIRHKELPFFWVKGYWRLSYELPEEEYPENIKKENEMIDQKLKEQEEYYKNRSNFFV